ncbi:CoA transferase [Microbacterium sp. KNMS]
MTRQPDSPHDPVGGRRAIHHVGSEVARVLGLRAEELATIDRVRGTASWESRLRVDELAYDSVALASLAIALVGVERGSVRREGALVALDAARVRASFGSEKVFAVDGEAPTIWAPLSGFWRAADGWVRTHGNYGHHAERLARLLGLGRVDDRVGAASAIRSWSRFEIESRANEAGALAVAVRDVAEWHDHPHFPTVHDRPIIRFESRGAAAPRAWSDRARRPLSGVRVLDLTRVIAGPVATRDLALAGAEVLRIDSPRLPEAAWQHLDTGHEKRSALLDFHEAADLLRLERLLADADVVVHGYRPSALDQFGLDAESLHRRFPGLVVAQLSAWGADGPWGRRRGFDSLVQAATGIAMLESADGVTPGALPVQALDHATGHFLAASVATAVRAQRSSGGSFEVHISLARIAQELVASGAADGGAPRAPSQPLSSVQVPLAASSEAAAAIVTCAPPVLGFPGAPREYRSPLHAWGGDAPRWVDHLLPRKGRQRALSQ